jgi:negative regulator of flagellin synthesis FlgM
MNHSTKAIDIKQLRDAINRLPDIREDKVRELKDKVERGIYDVDGQKIAEKMMVDSLLDIFAKENI